MSSKLEQIGGHAYAPNAMPVPFEYILETGVVWGVYGLAIIVLIVLCLRIFRLAIRYMSPRSLADEEAERFEQEQIARRRMLIREQAVPESYRPR